MKSKLSKSRRLNSSIISNSSSTSSKQVKLRTIMKGRGSQQSFVDKESIQPSRNSSRINDENQERLSTSLNFNIHIPSRLSHTPNQPTNRNNQYEDTQNCQQQLLGKQDKQFQYKLIYNKLDELQAESQQLIRKKIRKISRKSDIITLKDKGKDEISEEIEDLVRRIQRIKIDELEKLSISQQKIRHLMDRKITILEKLIASNSTESQMLKRQFFAISAINSQPKDIKKVKKNSSFAETKNKNFLQPLFSRAQRSRTEAKQSISKESSNRAAYNAPKIHEYETYRYREKDYKANLQPLPRSSYKSEYLVYSPKGVAPALKNFDNHTSFGNTRLKSSTYGNDYQGLKTEVVNYKELDSYRNKIRDLEIQFGHKNKKQFIETEFEKNRSYIAQQLLLQTSKHSALLTPKSPQSRIIQKKLISSTQAKSQFKGQKQQILTSIKNRRLNNFKYVYKTLANK